MIIGNYYSQWSRDMQNREGGGVYKKKKKNVSNLLNQSKTLFDRSYQHTVNQIINQP